MRARLVARPSEGERGVGEQPQDGQRHEEEVTDAEQRILHQRHDPALPGPYWSPDEAAGGQEL